MSFVPWSILYNQVRQMLWKYDENYKVHLKQQIHSQPTEFLNWTVIHKQGIIDVLAPQNNHNMHSKLKHCSSILHSIIYIVLLQYYTSGITCKQFPIHFCVTLITTYIILNIFLILQVVLTWWIPKRILWIIHKNGYSS